MWNPSTLSLATARLVALESNACLNDVGKVQGGIEPRSAPSKSAIRSAWSRRSVTVASQRAREILRVPFDVQQAVATVVEGDDRLLVLLLRFESGSIAPRIAWHVSGAGIRPSVFAKISPAWNVLSWSTARGSTRPASSRTLKVAAVTWDRRPPAWMRGGTNVWSRVRIFTRRVISPVSPQSYSYRPCIIEGTDVGSTAMNRVSERP